MRKCTHSTNTTTTNTNLLAKAVMQSENRKREELARAGVFCKSIIIIDMPHTQLIIIITCHFDLQ